jgi:hypothetical protein
MPGNHLEQLVGEWYEFRGYFVRRNIPVARRPKGGFDGELDVVAFHAQNNHLVHIEPSNDADPWSVRERRFARKFEAGRKYIPGLFAGIKIPARIEQIALLGFASTKHHKAVGGGRIMLIPDLLAEILRTLKEMRVAHNVVPEQFPLIRTLQYVCEHRGTVAEALKTD